MAVANLEQRAVDEHRNVQGGAGDELLVVEVAGMPCPADCCSRDPTSGAGATPMLPKNGRSGMTMPGANSAVIFFLIQREGSSCGTLFSQLSGRKPLQPL